MFDSKYGKIDIPGTPENEPCIVLRAQDVFAVGVLKIYYMMASHKNDVHLQVIKNTIDKFIAWPKRKIPS